MHDCHLTACIEYAGYGIRPSNRSSAKVRSHAANSPGRILAPMRSDSSCKHWSVEIHPSESLRTFLGIMTGGALTLQIDRSTVTIWSRGLLPRSELLSYLAGEYLVQSSSISDESKSFLINTMTDGSERLVKKTICPFRSSSPA